MIRVGILGAGAWGINHVRVVTAEAGCELVAVADPDPDAVARVRAFSPGARVERDADRVLSDRDVDAIIIASPAPTHAALATTALRAGKHVLIEKPMAMKLAEAKGLVELARSARRTAMVGHLMVFHPAVIRLRELLGSGALGKLHYLHSTRVNLGRIRRDENALWSFGPHDLSMIEMFVAGQPQSVAARGQCVLQQGVEDVVFLTMRYPGGEMAHVQLSWLSPRKERRLTLVGSSKMAEFDDVGPHKLRIFDKGYDRPPEFTEYAQYLTLRDGDVHIPQLAMQEPLRLQLQHFLACVASGATPRTDLAHGLRVTEILEAAQASLARDGAPVELAHV